MAALAAPDSSALFLAKARSDFSVRPWASGALRLGRRRLARRGLGESELGFLVGLALPFVLARGLAGLVRPWRGLAALSSRPSHQVPAAIAATRTITSGTTTQRAPARLLVVLRRDERRRSPLVSTALGLGLRLELRLEHVLHGSGSGSGSADSGASGTGRGRGVLGLGSWPACRPSGRS